jgi:hypothetical protein
MSLVWSESIPQANQMLNCWKNSADIRRIGKDVRRSSLHVLSNFAFGKPYSFDSSADEALQTGDSLSYKDSSGLILENCILILLYRKMATLSPEALAFGRSGNKHIQEAYSSERPRRESPNHRREIQHPQFHQFHCPRIRRGSKNRQQ